MLCYAKSLQSCPTLCDPVDGSPPGSLVPGILQARTLEWVAISFSNACFVSLFRFCHKILKLIILFLPSQCHLSTLAHVGNLRLLLDTLLFLSGPTSCPS